MAGKFPDERRVWLTVGYQICGDHVVLYQRIACSSG